jgi:hypothetical protein
MSDYTEKELKEMADEYHLRKISETIEGVRNWLIVISFTLMAILIRGW